MSEVDDKKKSDPSDSLPISTAEEELAEVLESANALVETISKRDDVDPNTAIMARQLLSSVMELKDLPSTNTRADENLVQQAIAAKTNEEKLNVVISEYEKTIAKLIRDNACIVKERDTFQVHLANVEAAFSDVHQKYERCKGVIEGFSNNEKILKDTIKVNEDSILKLNNKYEALKSHAKGQLDKANAELIEMKKNYEDEIIRLEATIKKLELKNSSLQSAVDQRVKECEELSSICDELIAKVGRKN
ncbi:transforming acidic coiled-coil-containing protein 1-like [Chrysoperla carnea]|uniref:transforming acidic coiled-coil-containing protein 1-like n=1 Tax=Chrysoperla carnea TaxID=189513 RepID=UPI001D05EE60|nr:transforming acidic coiled-coil-containing protein 1-like [Chrysoperla carnea]XP_044740877.1 transforming acidic coiled-coil-containing protein 1-like [Chrysoperla carnea]XP_044740878.1 transforming acidic coiled-coil-containing protein 1-like [Chrysoperla carnea]